MNKEAKKTSETEIVLSQQEKKLIEIIRSLEYGEVRVILNEGKPTRIEEIKKSIKL